VEQGPGAKRRDATGELAQAADNMLFPNLRTFGGGARE
jgi:hypothetical protein